MRKIFHIPHSSTIIPNRFLSDYLISKSELDKECKIMCDINTDLLVDDNDTVIKFEYSRIFCDVERFNSSKEEMNCQGMGVLYTNSHDLNPIRIIKNDQEILEYYYSHHNRLNELCRNILNTDNEVLIIDLHSYSKKPLKYELHKDLLRPEICIGIDNIHMTNDLKNKILYIVNEFDFDYKINQPFIGCMIPSLYENDKRVKGVMIEIRKDIIKNQFQKTNQLIKCLKEI